MAIIVFGLVTVLGAWVTATIGADKGYPQGAGWVLGFGLPVLALVIAVLLPRRDPVGDD